VTKASLFGFVNSKIDSFLPSSVVQADDDTRRRGRLVIQFSLIIFLCGPGYGALYLLLGMPVSAVGAGLVTVMLAAAPWLFRRCNSLAFAAHWVTLACYLALLLVTLPTGGLTAPAIAWLSLIPITALMLAGKRGGAVWALVSVASVGAYFLLDQLGLTPTSEAPAAWLPVLRLMVNAGLVGLIAWLAWVYESNKDHMLGVLRSANSEIAEARDAARRAHQEARLVLDHTHQGLVMVDRAGKISGERSRVFDRLFSEPATGTQLAELFAGNSDFAASLSLGWDELAADVLPIELVLDQLPKQYAHDGKSLRLEYVPVGGESFQQALVIVSDVTAEVQASLAEQRQRDQLEVFRRIVQDRGHFLGFYQDADRLVDSILHGEGDAAEQRRWIHTLKGNAGMFGLNILATNLHQLEDQLKQDEETAGLLNERQSEMLREQWRAVRELIEPLLGDRTDDSIVLGRACYEHLLEALRRGDSHAELLDVATRWSWEPTSLYLGRLAEHARALAKRMGKGEVDVVIEDGDVRLPPAGWGSFWSSAVHLVRNALDHGIEPSQERLSRGKSAGGRLMLRADATQSGVVFEVADDGRGIDWEKVEERAAELGLPSASTADLKRALFFDGLSTRGSVSELSGRGVGMSAVLETCKKLGGEIEVRSEPGEGTRFLFRFPMTAEHSS
jgi:signal transduction histidine kinase